MEQGKNEVVLQLLENEETSNPKREIRDSKGSPLAESSSNSFYRNTHMDSSPKSPELLDNFRSSGSPELKKSPAESRKSPPVIRRRSMVRSEFSKPKSRLLEPSYPKDSNFIEEKTQKQSPKKSSSSNKNSPSMDFPNQKVNETPITPRTPLIGEDGEEEEEEDDEVYNTANLKVSQKPGKKWRLKFMLEWIALICILGFLIASFTVNKLQNRVMWGLELWKWCVLALVILCGRLVTYWFMNFLVFLIEMNFFFKKKVLYFVYGVKKSVQVFIWLSLVLLAWSLLFNHGVPRSRKTTRVLNYITRALASCLIGVTMWLVKTLLIKLLAASFQSSRFFDRIQEAIFHQYILRALSGPPVMEAAEMVGKSGSSGRLSFRTFNKGSGEGKKEEVIDVDKLKRMKQDKISAWTMKGLINVIRTSGLYTISGSSESDDDDDDKSETKEKEITSAWEAKAAAYRIFMNVAKPGSNYIEKEDLLRFMNKEAVENVLPLFEGAVETGKIKRKSLKNWLVKVYLERQSLVHSLNDTKTAIEELNKLASVIVLVVIIIVWLLIMGFLTTKVLVFISSQLLLVVFMFGNTAKTVFEAIIFVFVMHPFDVGDRCVIDGVQMVVEEMNILTTVFLRYDNEKIFYPNSVLASKPISNFYRSPEMSDSIEFSVDFSTSVESIGALKAKIKGCLEIKPQHWRPNHSVVVKGIEDMNKLKMALSVTHTINFQNYGDKNSRRSELILELKKIFEDLNIKYHLPPQEVHLSYAGPAATSALPAWR